MSGLGASVASIGAKGFAVATAAAAGLATAAAIGIKKAFDLGGTLADMSAISGRSAREILLLRRALEDAGVSMEKIDRFILTGQDRGEVIARALQNISSGDWKDAAASIGKQADILDKNAATFDRVSDLLGRSGQKLQGFFVGAAGQTGKALLPLLEKFDKMDFASQGERFGEGLLKGVRALVGVFQKPEDLVRGLEDAFTAAALGLGNVLVAVIKQAAEVLDALVETAWNNLTTPNKKGLERQIGILKASKALTFGPADTALQEKIDELEQQKANAPETSKGIFDVSAAKMPKLEIVDVFGARDALANAQTGVNRSAATGQGMLPPEAGATARTKGMDDFGSASWWKRQHGQSDEGMDLRSGAASKAPYGSSQYWKELHGQKDEGATSSKTDEKLDKISGLLETSNDFNQQVWGGK